MVMNNKKRLGLGLSVLLVILLGFFWYLPNFVFTNGQPAVDEVYKKIKKLNIPKTKHEPPKQEIRQVFEYKWDQPVDSCSGLYPFFWQVRFDPLPEVNKPTKIYVKLKSCWGWKTDDEYPNIFVHSVFSGSMDFTGIEPQWIPPIKKGDIYEGAITITPWDIGKYVIHIALITGGLEYYFDFDESGKLVHLSDREFESYSLLLPNHPLITDKEIYVKFNGQYVTNLFHITPPLSLNDTSTVYYRVITKDYYPDGMKIVTRDHHNFSFKMLPGPITKGDTLEGSFKVIPPRVGWNSIGLRVEEPPREGAIPKNDTFSVQYHLLKDGKLLYIVKSQKEYNAFFEYYKKRGMDLEKF